MATYFPPLFCRKGTTLKVRKHFIVEFDVGDTMTLRPGDHCTVDDIIGYGFNIKKDAEDEEFRIMNSSMSDYFDIIDKVEPQVDLKESYYNRGEGTTIRLERDFEIKDKIQISKGQQFLHFTDMTKNRLFHNLFSPDGKNKILRMNDQEFKKYFKN